MTASELRAEFRAALIDATRDLPNATVNELLRGLDVVLTAVMDEFELPAVTGDVLRRLEDLLVASYGEVADMDAFVDEMSQRGLYVLDRGAYDALVKAARAGGGK